MRDTWEIAGESSEIGDWVHRERERERERESLGIKVKRNVRLFFGSDINERQRFYFYPIM